MQVARCVCTKHATTNRHTGRCNYPDMANRVNATQFSFLRCSILFSEPILFLLSSCSSRFQISGFSNSRHPRTFFRNRSISSGRTNFFSTVALMRRRNLKFDPSFSDRRDACWEILWKMKISSRRMNFFSIIDLVRRYSLEFQ